MPTPTARSPWLMLMALTTAFALSQAFRTLAAILAPPIAKEFSLTAQSLGLFAGAFHFAFGGLQLVMGIGIDMHGMRRTVLAVFPLTIVGALLCALAPGFEWLVIGQVLIGFGCAPAFLVCTVFVARCFAPGRFAAVSGLTMGIGSVGMLLTGTPLAWLVEALSWRAGFLALAVLALVSWIVIFVVVREPEHPHSAQRMPMLAALRTYGELFRLPHTVGIVALASVSYASFLSVRGLWLGPLLIERHGFSLIESGNVALAVSIVSMAGPPIFGRFDPGPERRRRWIIGFTLLVAALFVVSAFNPGAFLDCAIAMVIGLLAGFIVFQYADVRGSYPASMTGRALALFTMAMFLGVALMQWFTGVVATVAHAHGVEPYLAVLLAIALLLCLGAALFRGLPQPSAAKAGDAVRVAQ